MKYADLDMNTAATTATFALPPQPVGWWIMPGSTKAFRNVLGCYSKPNWLVRTSMRYVFGFIYEDAP